LPKWKAASARPRHLYLDTKQALKHSVKPSWEDIDEADNGTQPYALEDAMKGDKVLIEHLSHVKCMKVAIDATVANELLNALLVDPHSYADFDHSIPPITQAQLSFVLSSNDSSVVQPPLLDDAADSILVGPVAGDKL
jgi:hypothetical protein